ncbi:hypothetical protein GCM10010191_23690 [Actinomadura vinacea]|uniref:histidine kinase n=1 Tax=Actinomadura vinacea TaxID=115336 RepID=A0ABP5VY48_9ACTN
MAGRLRSALPRRDGSRPRKGASRTRSVRSRIVFLMVPLVTALVVVWGVAATGTLRENLRQTRAQTFTQKVLNPTDEVIAALQDERRMSLSFLGDDATIGRAGFDAQRAVTDRARAQFRRSAADGDTRGATRPATRQRMTRLVGALGGLEALRAAVDGRSLDRARALVRYTEYIDLAAEIYDEVYALDPELVRANRILRTLERARESLSREDALVTGVLAAGRLDQAEHLQLVQLVGAHRFMYADAARGLTAADQARFDRIVGSPEARRFQDMENRLMAGGASEGRPVVDAGAWRTSTETVDAQLAGLSSDIRSGNTRGARDEAGAVLLRLGLMGGLGLVAVLAAILIAARAGRRLIAESRGMAAAVTAFAQDRLPLIGERARRGEDVQAADDLGAARFRVTEIAQIDRAFAEARRAVVAAAGREAAAHRRLNEVFVTLARRNQSLLQRLLRMLESMQRRTEDPDELERLFELDSLATRMRRHAEGLVILSGRPSGRSWRNPVRLVDVARAAVAEVEDYSRVEVVPMGRIALRGPAVADTIHLMAELIENAAAFSPPKTPIRVSGQEVAHGFALEVEDRGLGIAHDDMDAYNRLLETDPELDLDDSARLGMFVVARLAARHGIKVTLRKSPYGGVIAIALIPHELVVQPEEAHGGSDERRERRAQRERREAGEERELIGSSPVSAIRESVEAVAGQGSGFGSGSRSGKGGSGEADRADPPAESPAEAPAEAPAEPPVESPTLATGAFPLPVRRRQTHLAPQLKGSSAAKRDEPSGGEPGRPRSPESARDLMSTMQRGWRRGRADASGAEDGADRSDGSGAGDSGGGE